MNWGQYQKGQPVRFRALGGWLRGHVSEVYDNSVSVAFSRGSHVYNTRIHDIRNIQPCQSPKEKPFSASPENPSFEL